MKIACIIGTRPEVIKMAPLIHALRAIPSFRVTVIATAQHRGLLDDMMKVFDLQPDIDLDIMKPNHSLAQLTSLLCEKLDPLFKHGAFDLTLAQGDTTTTFISALVSFYHQTPFGHIEAGLRSYDLSHPFPEEYNRIMVSHSALWNFAPTLTEKENLIKEGVKEERIYITGNTVIDALYWILEKNKLQSFNPFPGKRIILVTSHRRENHGKPLENICAALIKLSELFPDIAIVYPVHPNPHVQTTVKVALKNRPNIHLLPPLHYDEFAHYIQAAHLILTDSGGLQEEGPALRKPVLILRETTERPALIETGTGMLVGTLAENIVAQTSRLLTDTNFYNQMASGVSPYGDGQSVKRIVDILLAS